MPQFLYGIQKIRSFSAVRTEQAAGSPVFHTAIVRILQPDKPIHTLYAGMCLSLTVRREATTRPETTGQAQALRFKRPLL